MDQLTAEISTLMDALSPSTNNNDLALDADPGAAGAKAAIRRCEAAWKRCFDVYMRAVEAGEEMVKSGKAPEILKARKRARSIFPGDFEAKLLAGHEDIFAASEADKAYCRAMPVLAGYDGVRNFTACVAHGILIGTIKESDSTKLLYAAQIALAIAGQERKVRCVGSLNDQ